LSRFLNQRNLAPDRDKRTLTLEKMTMKRSNLKKLTLLAVLAATLLISNLGLAQMGATQYKATIPFEFQLAGKVLPAGNYIVKVTDHFVQIRPVDSAKGVGIVTLRAERKQTAKKDMLEFNVYGNQYFLSQVWFEGSELGRSVVTSKAEMEIASETGESHIQLAMKK
jgi:hypothetical protein